MKKILIFSYMFSFIVGGFLLVQPTSAFALNDGCALGQNYSTTTGQRCGCSHNEIYSSTTGLMCARESQVTGYLTEQGPSIYMWGTHSITNDGFAVCVMAPCPSAESSYLVSAGGSSSVLSDLRRYENSKVKITGRLQWYDLEGGFWGFAATDVTPINTNEEILKVLSPNGGETIRIGQKYNIDWDSANLSGPKVNIYLKDDSINCADGIVGCWSSYGIAGPIQNNRSYLWDTSKNLFGPGGPNSYTIQQGINYRIKVCSSISNVCDESDNYFKFVSQQTNVPVISGISGPQNLNVNQSGTWEISASDTNGGNLYYYVNWGDNIYREATSETLSLQQIEQQATFTHTYTNAGVYNPVFTVSNSNGARAQTSLSVNVGNSIYPPGCISNIGYSTITGANCGGACVISGAGSSCYSPDYTPSRIFDRTLRLGYKGQDVKNLQSMLGINSDGSYGQITKAKVMQWQIANGLKPDGIFGPASYQVANTSGL